MQFFSLELPAKRGHATRQPREAAPKDKGASFPSHPHQRVSSGNFCEYILLTVLRCLCCIFENTKSQKCIKRYNWGICIFQSNFVSFISFTLLPLIDCRWNRGTKHKPTSGREPPKKLQDNRWHARCAKNKAGFDTRAGSRLKCLVQLQQT